MGETEILIKALGKVVDHGTLAAFQLLVIAGLSGLIRYLLLELKDARKEYTASVMQFVETISQMKEIIRHAFHKQ